MLELVLPENSEENFRATSNASITYSSKNRVLMSFHLWEVEGPGDSVTKARRCFRDT